MRWIIHNNLQPFNDRTFERYAAAEALYAPFLCFFNIGEKFFAFIHFYYKQI